MNVGMVVQLICGGPDSPPGPDGPPLLDGDGKALLDGDGNFLETP